MVSTNLPRIVIAGTQSGVGKTTLTLGIMAALHRRGLKVGGYKVGPDYIDPGFHTFVTGVPSRNLDLWLLTEEKVRYLFQKNSRDVEISIIEGVMGLYDGRGTDAIASTAHLSKILNAPVILVIDGSGVSTSAAAQVLGYQKFDPDVALQGVIINRVSGDAHYQLLKEAIERETGVPTLGYLARRDQIQLKSRHLGLVPGVEVDDLKKQIEELIGLIEESVDLDGLLKLAKTAPVFGKETEPEDIKEAKLKSQQVEWSSSVKIGVAYDEAFHFYYQDNLDLLQELGAELVYFSPLHDQKLPENLDGFYIGGGFPEEFGYQLEKNRSMRQEIATAIESGIPTYAECGGMMYLSQSIQIRTEESYQMVGVVPSASVMTDRLQRFGYVEVELGENLFHLKGTVIPAHEFHYSKLLEDTNLPYTYQIRRRNRSWHCGVGVKNLLAGYPHLHFYSNPELALQFVLRCRLR